MDVDRSTVGGVGGPPTHPKDADGKMVGPAFKTMKSEFVAWQEAIRAKKV